MPSALDIQTASINDYWVKNSRKLSKRMIAGFTSASLFGTKVPNVFSTYRSNIVDFVMPDGDGIIQAFQCKFTPKGDVKFTPEDIASFPIKVDLEFPCWNDLLTRWTGWLADNCDGETSADVCAHPKFKSLQQWILENVIIPRIENDYEYRSIFKGVYVPPTDGVAGTSAGAFDGMLKIISDAILAGKIIPYSAGPIVSTGIREYVEDFYNSLPVELKDEPMILTMSSELLRKYAWDYRAEFGSEFKYEGLCSIKGIECTNIQFYGAKGLNGSDRMWITPHENMVMTYGCKDLETMLEVESSKRSLSAFTDWNIGIGFQITKGMVWANDLV